METFDQQKLEEVAGKIESKSASVPTSSGSRISTYINQIV